MTQARFVTLTMRTIAVLAVGLAVTGWLLGEVDFAVGVAGGGLFGMANFYGVAWVVNKLTSSSPGQSKAFFRVFVTAKLGLLALVIYLAIRYFALDPLGFMTGYSTMIVALVAVGFVYAASERNEENGIES